MPRIALTDRFVAAAKPDSTGRTDYFDATTKGLALRVTNTHRAWTFNFTSPKDNKRARVTLGSYPAISLAKARGLALEAKGHVEAQQDPRDVLAAQDATAMTMADLIGSYLEKHVRARNLKSARHMELRLAANVTPVIGVIKLADIHRRDVNRILDAIMARGRPTQARLVFQDLRAILRWAVARGDLDHSPIEGMAKPGVERPRERVLSDDEIRSLWNGLPKSLAKSKACQRIIRLCLVTGQRVGEVAGMRRDELNLPARTWTLPGARTKNKHPHIVPLSALAIDIIEEALADAGDGRFLFPCGKGSLAPGAVARTICRAHEPTKERPLGRFCLPHWTCHDLRRSVLTGMARLGISPTVLGFVANHRTVTRGGITMGVYVHYSHDREKGEALDLWAERLAAVVSGKPAASVTVLRA
jgi:integrase